MPDGPRGVLFGGAVGCWAPTAAWPGCRTPRRGWRQRRGQHGGGGHTAVQGTWGTGHPAPVALLPGDRRGFRHRILSPVRRRLPLAARRDDVVLGSVHAPPGRA